VSGQSKRPAKTPQQKAGFEVISTTRNNTRVFDMDNIKLVRKATPEEKDTMLKRFSTNRDEYGKTASYR
jgi:hypothetical protein